MGGVILVSQGFTLFGIISNGICQRQYAVALAPQRSLPGGVRFETAQPSVFIIQISSDRDWVAG